MRFPHALRLAAAARRRAAFSLIELLTVIAIIGILAALLIGVVGRMRESARSTRCTANLRQLHQAAMLWGNDHRRIIPAGNELRVGTTNSDGSFQRFEARLRPYLSALNNQRADQRSAFSCPSAELLPQHQASPIHGYGVVDTVDGTAGRGRTFLQRGDPRRPFIADKLVYGADGSLHGNDYVGLGTVEYRHGGRSKANVVFFGGHVESIDRERAATLLW